MASTVRGEVGTGGTGGVVFEASAVVVATPWGVTGFASVSVSVFVFTGTGVVTAACAAMVVSVDPADVDASSKGRGSSDGKVKIELTSSRSERDAAGAKRAAWELSASRRARFSARLLTCQSRLFCSRT